MMLFVRVEIICVYMLFSLKDQSTQLVIRPTLLTHACIYDHTHTRTYIMNMYGLVCSDIFFNLNYIFEFYY